MDDKKTDNVVNFEEAKKELEEKTLEEVVEEHDDSEILDEDGTPDAPAIDRFERKLEKGKKPTAQDSLQMAKEVRHMFNLMAKDVNMMAEQLQFCTQMMQQVYQLTQANGASLNFVLRYFEEELNLFEREKFETWIQAEVEKQEEEMKKKQEAAQAEAVEKMKEESVAAAEKVMKEEDGCNCSGCDHKCNNEQEGELNESETEDG